MSNERWLIDPIRWLRSSLRKAGSRFEGWSGKRPFSKRLYREIIVAPFEPILHLTSVRLKMVGLALFFGHIIFGLIWTFWVPQPYENLYLRGFLSFLGLML